MDRRQSIVNICLEHFIQTGLLDASTRSLSNALNLKNASLYHYFHSKDEAVLICAEEALMRLERALIQPALNEFSDLERMIDNLRVRADELSPLMRFFVSVCAQERYDAHLRPILARLNERYDHYAQMMADMLGCTKEHVEPYMWMLITAVSNYMIFSDAHFMTPQVEMAYREFLRLSKLSAEKGRMDCE